ncbi:MAG: GNAT family N-acetyltransferase [Cytophagales bacterium]|nr:MAG: GNAT family N-acetyltransferase [Cytophagales bacterium]
MKIIKYQHYHQTIWDSFVRNDAKNATFLHERSFMEYHGHRFEDFSLLFWKNQELLAVLPAHVVEDCLYSHQGLSFGGILWHRYVRLQEVKEVYQALFTYLQEWSLEGFYFSPTPTIYHKAICEEDLYATYLFGAKVQACEVGMVIDLEQPFPMQDRRWRAFDKAKKHSLSVEKSVQFEEFWTQILIPQLTEKYDRLPVHNIEEIRLLAQHFPLQIHLYTVKKEEELLAGVVVFEHQEVIHLQYIASNTVGRQVGALDFLLFHLWGNVYFHKRYLSFGISNTQHKQNALNEGLLEWKESWGARLLTHLHYGIDFRP